jgi:hypothetical protein
MTSPPDLVAFSHGVPESGGASAEARLTQVVERQPHRLARFGAAILRSVLSGIARSDEMAGKVEEVRYATQRRLGRSPF